ncbi:hypothetical protein TNCT_472841 [Trichonephila clavata]|uniref:Uncharacterized protein n=1 Tax=Trichonephila clavata TaxID=2740835 RepID=A0A8X6K6H1_TRICU|nr:hypothetical protein TNCT_472841 [Trichonephila clavata]
MTNQQVSSSYLKQQITSKACVRLGCAATVESNPTFLTRKARIYLARVSSSETSLPEGSPLRQTQTGWVTLFKNKKKMAFLNLD